MIMIKEYILIREEIIYACFCLKDNIIRQRILSSVSPLIFIWHVFISTHLHGFSTFKLVILGLSRFWLLFIYASYVFVLCLLIFHGFFRLFHCGISPLISLYFLHLQLLYNCSGFSVYVCDHWQIDFEWSFLDWQTSSSNFNPLFSSK